MPWRWVASTAAAALAVVAGVVLLLQVEVGGAGRSARPCGSAWDVVAGRTGWSEWWAQDLADPAGGSGGRLVRTLDCPAAVNGRVVAAGALAAGAVLLLSVGELTRRRARRGQREVRSSAAVRLRLLGAALTVLGVALTVGGLVGIALLVADPGAALFLYVSRPVIVIAGLLLLVPAIVLVALGRGAGLVADLLPDRRAGREDA